MRDYCLDANVIIGAYCPDENSEACRSLINRITQESSVIQIPALMNFEVPGALNKKERLKLISAEDVGRILRSLYKLPLILVWNEPLIQHAMSIQREINTAFYDSCYLALAHIKDIPLITADKDLLRKGRKIHSAIFLPEEMI